MKSRLIALIDFSTYSYAIAELAVRLAEISKAQLIFVHQVPGLVPGMADDASKKELIEGEKNEALEKLRNFVSEKNFGDDDVRYVVTESHLLTAIDDLIKDGFNDILLVGIKGTGLLRQMLMGNTATTIINEVNRTVVAVPEKLCAVPNEFCNLLPKRLVVSLSYQFPLNEKGFDNFLTHFKTAITQIEFISSISDDEKEEQADGYLSSLASRYSMSFKSSYTIFKGKKHFEQIKSYVRAEPNTILIVQKGSRDLTDMFFRKFLINEVVNDGSLPMVVLPSLSN